MLILNDMCYILVRILYYLVFTSCEIEQFDITYITQLILLELDCCHPPLIFRFLGEWDDYATDDYDEEWLTQML